jgi:hypothetical protein
MCADLLACSSAPLPLIQRVAAARAQTAKEVILLALRSGCASRDDVQTFAKRIFPRKNISKDMSYSAIELQRRKLFTRAATTGRLVMTAAGKKRIKALESTHPGLCAATVWLREAAPLRQAGEMAVAGETAVVGGTAAAQMETETETEAEAGPLALGSVVFVKGMARGVATEPASPLAPSG